jgi:hypothetical protein
MGAIGAEMLNITRTHQAALDIAIGSHGTSAMVAPNGVDLGLGGAGSLDFVD